MKWRRVKYRKILRSVPDVNYHKVYNVKAYQESNLAQNNKEIKGNTHGHPLFPAICRARSSHEANQ